MYSFVLQVIAAEGEKNASVALRSASDIITGNPAAMQLRYLQVGTDYVLVETYTSLYNLGSV